MHSGAAANTCAVAPFFRRVLCVEISRELVAAARHNCAANGCANVRVLRADCGAVCRALIADADSHCDDPAQQQQQQQPALGGALLAGEGDGRVMANHLPATADADADDQQQQQLRGVVRAGGRYRFRTLIVDPPRGGLDDDTLRALTTLPPPPRDDQPPAAAAVEASAGGPVQAPAAPNDGDDGGDPRTCRRRTSMCSIDHVLGVWCNAEAMLHDLGVLKQHFEVMSMCFLDMFPFTQFLEVALRLQRRRSSSRTEAVG
jgi:tRNA/tmRNA/rRNA uracil-C5-methylase (TrmA/RlmC/RlmD family)